MSTTKNTEDIYTRFFRIVSKPLVSLLFRLKAIPNHISILSLLIFIASGILLIIRSQTLTYRILVFVLIQVGYYFDICDGELARRRKMVSTFGAWLDSTFDLLSVNWVIFSMVVVVISQNYSLWIIILGIGCQMALFLPHRIRSIYAGLINRPTAVGGTRGVNNIIMRSGLFYGGGNRRLLISITIIFNLFWIFFIIDLSYNIFLIIREIKFGYKLKKMKTT
ncbi:MAG: hypothetical protein CMB97_00515 [Flavobacteriaceae bacterium]|nr:hypothetical protein [Flavobacteriaceae bacterium]